MNYWQRWIGDWKRKTAHLSACEKGIYGELLDYLYANDLAMLPLEPDSVARIAGAANKQEIAAVESVLKQFFDKQAEGYFSKRTAEELRKRGDYVEQQRELANRRWEKERAKPVKANGSHHPKAIELPDWLDAATFNAWIQIRPAKARTVSAQAAALEKLSGFKAQGHDPNAIVKESLANGWQGIFSPSSRRGQQSIEEKNQQAANQFLGKQS